MLRKPPELTRINNRAELSDVAAGTQVLAVCRSAIPSETCNFSIQGEKVEPPPGVLEAFGDHCLFFDNYHTRRFGNKRDVPEHAGLLKGHEAELCREPIGYYLGASLDEECLEGDCGQKPAMVWDIYIVNNS